MKPNTQETLDQLAPIMARTFTVCEVADWSEEQENGFEWHAGGGQDWRNTVPDGYAPETLEQAKGVLEAIDWNIEADREATGLDLADYGHAIAMESLDHGVGRIDNAQKDYKVDWQHVPYSDGVLNDCPSNWIQAQENGTEGWVVL